MRQKHSVKICLQFSNYTLKYDTNNLNQNVNDLNKQVRFEFCQNPTLTKLTFKTILINSNHEYTLKYDAKDLNQHANDLNKQVYSLNSALRNDLSFYLFHGAKESRRHIYSNLVIGSSRPIACDLNTSPHIGNKFVCCQINFNECMLEYKLKPVSFPWIVPPAT